MVEGEDDNCLFFHCCRVLWNDRFINLSKRVTREEKRNIFRSENVIGIAPSPAKIFSFVFAFLLRIDRK